ncbi:MAG: UDP-N-acetylglucosamine 2-epimerase, partial [Deltaproteobacteria bacterium]|nr:UDP-N-acetylglucosamine 2-epimerase [Deltaproteobacteria bacterium]
VTERQEAVHAGTAILVGTNKDKIISETERILKSDLSSLGKKARNPYGDGKAAKRIADILMRLKITDSSDNANDCNKR